MRRIARLASRQKQSLILGGLLLPTDTLLVGFRDGPNGWWRIKNFTNTTIKTGYSSGIAVTDSVYANGKIITVGYIGASSIDGDTYTISPGSGNITFSAIAYGNGIFAGISSDNKLFYSNDGVNWTPTTSPLTTTITSGRVPSICFGNGKFVACGADDRLITSYDGVTWTFTNTLPIGVISYANEKWFGSGYVPGNKWRSNDGAGWNVSSTLTYNTAYTNVVYSNGKYIILSMDGYVYRSSDGITWSLFNGIHPTPSTKLVVKGLTIAYGTSDGYIVYSQDGGATWTQKYVGSSFNFKSMLLI